MSGFDKVKEYKAVPVVGEVGVHHPVFQPGVSYKLEMRVLRGDFIISRGYNPLPGQTSVSTQIYGPLNENITSLLGNLVENNDGRNYKPKKINN